MLTFYISVHHGVSIVSSQAVNQMKKRALEKLGQAFSNGADPGKVKP